MTEEDKRVQAFGLLCAAWGLGFIIGPVLGGFLAEIDPKLPFFAAAGFGALNVIYGFFVLSETFAKENRFGELNSAYIGLATATIGFIGLALATTRLALMRDMLSRKKTPSISTFWACCSTIIFTGARLERNTKIGDRLERNTKIGDRLERNTKIGARLERNTNLRLGPDTPIYLKRNLGPTRP